MSAQEPDIDSTMEDNINSSENHTPLVENNEKKDSSAELKQQEDQIVVQALDGIANDGSSMFLVTFPTY